MVLSASSAEKSDGRIILRLWFLKMTIPAAGGGRNLFLHNVSTS
jgi:hypothetical protein